MAKKHKLAAVFESEKPRLINFLEELCLCDPENIIWDGSGSSDIVVFENTEHRVMLKISKDNVSGAPGDCMDFRVRVMTA